MSLVHNKWYKRVVETLENTNAQPQNKWSKFCMSCSLYWWRKWKQKQLNLKSISLFTVWNAFNSSIMMAHVYGLYWDTHELYRTVITVHIRQISIKSISSFQNLKSKASELAQMGMHFSSSLCTSWLSLIPEKKRMEK